MLETEKWNKEKWFTFLPAAWEKVIYFSLQCEEMGGGVGGDGGREGACCAL